MKVNYNVNRGGTQGSQEINKNYFLPSINLRYNITENHALRLAASKTYTLPQSKEISPFRYVSVSFKSQGNPDLKPSDNYNVDLKWDWYLSPSELLSVTGFYKYIKDPISRIEVNSAGGYLSYRNISDHATVAGVEVELKKHIFSQNLQGEGLSRLTFGMNGAYTYTFAKVPLATDPSGSQLEGAAPWLVNADLTYMLRKRPTLSQAHWCSTTSATGSIPWARRATRTSWRTAYRRLTSSPRRSLESISPST